MLRLDHVTKRYRVGTFGSRELVAVRDVSLEVRPGEVVALIGQSGSGKSTIGRMILRLTSASEGTISFDGADVAGFKGARLRAYYADVQGVFQDPFSSYNPVFKVDRTLEPVRETWFARLSERAWRDKVEASLEAVRLDPGQVLGKYPLLVARALLLDIRLLVADEIISMLDASTRIDVLNLLGDLKARGLGILFITHDLSLGNYLSDTAVILHRGQVVETGPAERVFARPAHPYTRSLLASVPQLHHKWERTGHTVPEPAGESG
jgi:ABC-type oligopeptide transport system ATPase subunit